MAEDKKSIVVYADWINKFESLTDDEAGKLIKHFFRYVNDLSPVSDNRLVNLLFIDIENSLKRDLKKWEKELKNRKDNGRIGNIKRWYPDIYADFLLKRITLDQAEEIVRRRKLSLPDSPLSPPIAPVEILSPPYSKGSSTIAKIAVSDSVSVTENVSDSDTVSVTVTDILLKKVTKPKKEKNNKKQKKDNPIEDRRIAFRESLRQHETEFTPEMIEKFYLYWSEKSMDGKKMRMETQKTWETELRLKRWKLNNYGSNQGYTSKHQAGTHKVATDFTGSL